MRRLGCGDVRLGPRRVRLKDRRGRDTGGVSVIGGEHDKEY